MSAMQKISSRSPQVAGLIRDRKPFETHGALSAEAVTSLSVWASGQLSGPDEEKFREECRDIRYVVYSYSTPIAWWTETNGWHRVAQRFSHTTSVHQGKLYLIDEGTPRQPLFDEANPLPQCDGLPLDQTTCSDRAAHM